MREYSIWKRRVDWSGERASEERDGWDSGTGSVLISSRRDTRWLGETCLGFSGSLSDSSSSEDCISYRSGKSHGTSGIYKMYQMYEMHEMYKMDWMNFQNWKGMILMKYD